MIGPARGGRFDRAFLRRWDTAEALPALPALAAREEALRIGGGEGPRLLPLAAVRELVAVPELVPLPGAPPEVLGLAAVRGEVLAVVSLARILELPPAPPRCVAVVEAAGVRFALALAEAPRTVRLDPAAGGEPEAAGAAAAPPRLDLEALAARVFETVAEEREVSPPTRGATR